MGSETIQARFLEDTYPIGRFILDRARALGMSRSELVSRLGYRQIGKAQGAHRRADDRHRAAPNAEASRCRPGGGRRRSRCGRSRDDAPAARRSTSTDTCARGCLQGCIQAASAHRNHSHNPGADLYRRPTRHRPVAHAEVSSEVWNASADDRDRLVKRAIQDHYGERDGYVPAFGSIVSYTLVTMPGYLADYGFPFDTNGDRMGSIRPVERVGEAVLGTKQGDTRLSGLIRDTPIVILT
jgi:hypothetical protein